MKTLKRCINENKELKSTNINGYKTNADYIKYLKNNDDPNLFKQYAEEFVKIINKNNALKTTIIDAINDTNNILNIFYENNIMWFVNGQIIGKIIESVLAKRLNNSSKLNGFSYKQSTSAKFEKDFVCTDFPKNEIDKINIFKDKSENFFDIELKCSQSSQIIGGKSYAADKLSKKNKKSFYIFINYNKPNIPNECENDIEINKKFIIDVDKINISICYLEQCDWWYSSGGSCYPKLHILKDCGRIINI